MLDIKVNIHHKCERGRKKRRLFMDAKELMKKAYLTERDTSQLTDRAVSTLRNDRFLRRGIAYLKIGKRSVRYRLQDVLDYMESNRISF